MKLKFCIVALFLHNTQQTKLNQRQRIRNQFYAQANDEAAALNAYKDYNLDKSDYKQLAQKSGPDNDKKAFKLAEEMDEDEESQAPKNEQDDLLDADNVKQDEPKPKQKQSLLESVANNNPYGDSKPEKNEEEVEEQLQVSENALNLSQGEKQMRVDLTPSQESLYVGTIYIGVPSQPVRVFFDTGSEHLAVTSNQCVNCGTKAYNMVQSKTYQQLSDEPKTVLYGSAKLEGKETQDKACMSKDEGCINFKFLSLEKGEGLDNDADGILGLSPEMSTDRQDQHLVWSLMKQKKISKASFSLSMSERNSFAIFGGADFNQILGGQQGLRPFRNNPDIFSHIKAWALDGKGIFYGTPQIGENGSYPAVIDTGSTIIAVPSSLFASLESKWKETIKDLDCTTDPNFCVSLQQCEEIQNSLRPVGFLIAGGNQVGGETIFEINPSQYLFQAPDKCQFAITENKLDQFNNKNFIFGQAFLKHFYTVFNYENEQLSLGINVDSKGLVRMYNPGDGGPDISFENEPKVD